MHTWFQVDNPRVKQEWTWRTTSLYCPSSGRSLPWPPCSGFNEPLGISILSPCFSVTNESDWIGLDISWVDFNCNFWLTTHRHKVYTLINNDFQSCFDNEWMNNYVLIYHTRYSVVLNQVGMTYTMVELICPPSGPCGLNMYLASSLALLMRKWWRSPLKWYSAVVDGSISFWCSTSNNPAVRDLRVNWS
jgi:hypothetical protein